MTSDVTLRLVTPADASACNAFHNAYYRSDRSTQQWEWEFAANAARTEAIPFSVAELDGQVVGTQALIPIEFIDASGPYWTAKSEETLVDESMRGQKLFTRMYAPLLELARDRGYRFIWGFTPASNAFLREGFAVPARTGQMMRCFTPDAAARFAPAPPRGARKIVLGLASIALGAYADARSLAGGRASAPGLALREVLSAPEWADALSAAFVREWGGTTVHRSREYMRWRLFENPYGRPTVVGAEVDGAPVGWIAYGVGDDGIAAITDVVVVSPQSRSVPPDVVLRVLVRDAIRDCRARGAAGMRSWHVTAHPFSLLVRRVLAGMGWLHVARGFDMVVKQTPGLDYPPIRAEQLYVTRVFTEGATF